MMPNFISWIILIISFVLTGNSAHSSSQRLMRAKPETREQLSSLVRFLQTRNEQGNVDVWRLPRDVTKECTFAVLDGDVMTYADWLNIRDIPYSVDREDLKSLAQRFEDAEKAKVSRQRSLNTELDLDVYNDHQQINDFLVEMETICDLCQKLYIGLSYEEREMNVLKIGRNAPHKPFIWIDAGIHAREWIAPAAALKLIHKIVHGYLEEDPDVLWLLDNYVLFILPSANPDGYMFSRSGPDNRFWRKTRRPNKHCIGTDPNRNWNHHWAEVGTSPNPCADTYPGPRPFSEVETRNIRNFILPRRHQTIAYLALHSYGQYWMYPWGYNSSLPLDWEELHRVGSSAVEAIKDTHGRIYTLGSSTNVLYAAAGASDDWAKGVADIKYSYTVELRDVNDGEYGFLLPSDQIDPTSEELYAGIMAMIRAIYEGGNQMDYIPE